MLLICRAVATSKSCGTHRQFFLRVGRELFYQPVVFVTMMLNMDDAPSDPIERLMWLTGAKAQVAKELEQEFREAYFNARIQGRLDAAVSAGPYARKRVLAFTRAENEKRGRTVRWGDRADPTSTAYYSG